ncbi:hypothetical protein AN2V17_45780 [Vallitalea sp. AN17-2]|uniref:Uncharacterized protein n=1 Tax=Vallitalea maricola TaxID=3074433 RepID=A0ACB5URN9_9FIRM|nr:hypothetical protein AN2V17_45780 [Vallitalea sp. AN17-2]
MFKMVKIILYTNDPKHLEIFMLFHVGTFIHFDVDIYKKLHNLLKDIAIL